MPPIMLSTLPTRTIFAWQLWNRRVGQLEVGSDIAVAGAHDPSLRPGSYLPAAQFTLFYLCVSALFVMPPAEVCMYGVAIDVQQ